MRNEKPVIWILVDLQLAFDYYSRYRNGNFVVSYKEGVIVCALLITFDLMRLIRIDWCVGALKRKRF